MAQTLSPQPVSPRPVSTRLDEGRWNSWRRWQTPVALGLLLAACGLLLQVLLLPDPQGSLLWQRAQRLERDGLVTQALRNYRLLAEMHPQSRHAPEALWRQAEIHTELARAAPDQSADPQHLHEAVAAYTRLADTYARSPLAGQALLRTGTLLSAEFRDFKAARGVYERVLLEYPNNRDYASQATVQLGRVAIELRDGKTAQTQLQTVLRRYPALADRCAEAQFLLGICYETLFKSKEHGEMARNAYHTTIKKYGQSLWAGKARERLGLLNYDILPPIERRVLIEMRPLPDEKGEATGDSLLDALRLVLAARGVESGDTLLRGWGGAPFYAGYRPGQPSRVVNAPGDSFQTAAAAAGLLADLRRLDAKTALRDLQREIDDGHATLVYTDRWQLVAGYDNARNQVFLQSGAQQTTLPADTFAALWKGGTVATAMPGAAARTPSTSSGKAATAATAPAASRAASSPVTALTMLSFHVPGETARLQLSPLPSLSAGSSAVAPGTRGANSTRGASLVRNAVRNAPAQVTPVASPLTTPTFLLRLKPLDENAMHRRAIRHAVALMRRPGDGKILLNLEALRALSTEMRRLSASPTTEAGAADAGGSAVPDLSVPPVRSEELPGTTSGDAAQSSDGASPDTSTAPAGEASAEAGEISAESASGEDAAGSGSSGGAAGRAISSAALPGGGAASGTTSGAVARTAGIAPTDAPARARALLGWRGAPLQRWIASRRQAAAYLDLAGVRLKQSAPRRAATDFRRSVEALQNAAAALSTAGTMRGATLSDWARRSLATAAREVERALQAETRAVEAMSTIG